MDFLVEMRLADSSRPTTPQEGITFIEQYLLPTLELCKRLEAEKKIVAGGPVSGAIALAIMVRVESLQELDALIENLPLWPRMETTVMPVTSFDGRILAIRPRLERLQARMAAHRTSAVHMNPESVPGE